MTTHGKQHHQNQENDFQLLSNIHGELCQEIYMYVCTRQSKMQSKEVGSIDRFLESSWESLLLVVLH